MNKKQKTSYKKIILASESEDTQSSTNVKPVVGYDEIIQVLNEKDEKSHRKLNNGKKELLVDLLNDIGAVTDYVSEYYGFHGIGDSLRLEDVMNNFEKSLKVEVVLDNDDYVVSDDDDA
jgi:hypothetical protein